MNKSETVLSCIQPSGELHIGNYFGAVANWVKLQDQYPCIYGVVDLHAMTLPYQPAHLRENTERMVVDLIACGIDLKRTILFIQSLVPEHAELFWILSCVCPYGELKRMTQFKEKSEFVEEAAESEKSKAKQASRKQFVSSGLFNYPVLQAADILVYRAKYVPVGKDQEQHLELSSFLADRFNRQFGQTFFPEPQVLATETPKVVSLADPEKKMSKSLGSKHYVGLFEDEASVRNKVRAAVTDTGILPPGVYMSPGVQGLFEILQACGKQSEVSSLQAEYDSGQRQYGRLKEAVADALVELTGTLRAKREEVDPTQAMAQVRELSERAREIAGATLREVRSIVGLPERSY